MHSGIISETVQLDKNAREQVSALNKEKENLEARLKKDEKEIVLHNKKEIKAAILESKQKYEAEIEAKKVNEKIQFDQMLGQIKSAFEKKEAEWVESIYAFCID